MISLRFSIYVYVYILLVSEKSHGEQELLARDFHFMAQVETHAQKTVQGECREPAQESDGTNTSSLSSEGNRKAPVSCTSAPPSTRSVIQKVNSHLRHRFEFSHGGECRCSEQESQKIQRVRSHLWHQEETEEAVRDVLPANTGDEDQQACMRLAPMQLFTLLQRSLRLLQLVLLQQHISLN